MIRNRCHWRLLPHVQICAVLAAVTEVIRSQGGKETETEYFAALVSGCDLGMGCDLGVGVKRSGLFKLKSEGRGPRHGRKSRTALNR